MVVPIPKEEENIAEKITPGRNKTEAEEEIIEKVPLAKGEKVDEKIAPSAEGKLCSCLQGGRKKKIISLQRKK